MSIGTGIFWAGLFYFLVQLLGYIYLITTTRFPNKHVQRLDQLEATIARLCE